MTQRSDGGSASSTTWDGEPVAHEAPFGAAVIVYRRTVDGSEFLLLHRAHHGSEYEGDWAWTPPSGARKPGESIDECARRELLEEAGLAGEIVRTDVGQDDWPLYCVEIDGDVDVVLGDAEHDRFEWVSLSVALERCRPVRVADGLEAIARHVGA